MAIVWDQTYYIDPFGRRRAATETGMHWFFRLREGSQTIPPLTRGKCSAPVCKRVNAKRTILYGVSFGWRGRLCLKATAPLLPTGDKAPQWGKHIKDENFILSSPSAMAPT